MGIAHHIEKLSDAFAASQVDHSGDKSMLGSRWKIYSIYMDFPWSWQGSLLFYCCISM